MVKLILASASPRRKALLEQIGYQPEVFPVDIDEMPHAREDALAYVARVASDKLNAAWKAYPKLLGGDQSKEYVMLASDTSVVVDQEILGKPKDFAQFSQFMTLLSGREHSVVTAIACAHFSGSNDKFFFDTVTTCVRFRNLSSQDISAYWQSGEPQDKAGGYAIQGYGAVFVEGITGSYSNVVGLPLLEVDRVLKGFGLTNKMLGVQSRESSYNGQLN